MNDFDVVVKGEGEHAMLELLGAYESGNDLQSVQGIVYRKRDNDRAKFSQNHAY